MNTKHLSNFALQQCVFLLIYLFLFSSCANSTSPSKNVNPTREAQITVCHLQNMEVTLPKGWCGSGNTTMFYENYDKPGVYILIGSNVDPEQDISKNLELFLSTLFYKNRISFSYDEYVGKRVNGKLKNERLETTWYFSGYYMDDPDAYIFCLCENYEDKEYIEELAENAYSSMVALS